MFSIQHITCSLSVVIFIAIILKTYSFSMQHVRSTSRFLLQTTHLKQNSCPRDIPWSIPMPFDNLYPVINSQSEHSIDHRVSKVDIHTGSRGTCFVCRHAICYRCSHLSDRPSKRMIGLLCAFITLSIDQCSSFIFVFFSVPCWLAKVPLLKVIKEPYD